MSHVKDSPFDRRYVMELQHSEDPAEVAGQSVEIVAHKHARAFPSP
ncbi:hypothetical protein [uncultured Marivita sp.]|nr:hypothetical protein [uncultured Marivita sp.]